LCCIAQNGQGKYNGDFHVHRCIWSYVAVAGIIIQKFCHCKHGLTKMNKTTVNLLSNWVRIWNCYETGYTILIISIIETCVYILFDYMNFLLDSSSALKKGTSNKWLLSLVLCQAYDGQGLLAKTDLNKLSADCQPLLFWGSGYES